MEGLAAKGNSPGSDSPKQCRFDCGNVDVALVTIAETD